MNNAYYIILFLLILGLTSCGTGPWYIQKKLYKTYKDPIYKNASRTLKTNGYYQALTKTDNIDFSKSIIVFNAKGYCTFLSHTQLENEIIIETELDWWQIKNDSIIIENYGETKRLIKTLVWWHRGIIINDSIIEIAYQDKNYTYKPVKYKFMKFDKMPELKNKSRYFTKDWYVTELHESRK
jgi:hypothetical protein